MEKQTPKISVIMPAYNAEQYISEAIESILNQTYSNFEFIIIDDGSTDRTVEMVQSYSDPRIRFVQNEHNLGVAATLNRGLKLATGEYIARMDADDIALNNRFEIQVAFMDTHPEVTVLGTAIEKFGMEHGTVLFSEHHEDLKIDLLFSCCFAHPSVMMRAETLRHNGFRYDPAFSRMEDYDLWDRISVNHQLSALPDVLLRYRIHASQVTCNKTDMDFAQMRELKKRQIGRLGMEASGDGFESYVRFCEGSFVPARDSLLSLSGFFGALRECNSVAHVYAASALDEYLKAIMISLLNHMPVKESLSVSKESGVPTMPYAIKRFSHGVISRIKEKIRTKKRQVRLRNKDFSILCNNCWGGFIYQFFGLRYNTPTVGLYFLGKDFVKFAADLDHYLGQDLIFIPWEESSYYDHLKDNAPYPVAKLDDIEVYFMHYRSQEEAAEKWNKRKQRINRDKMLFKLSEREGCTREDVERFVALPLKNKICFSYDRVDGAIHVPELKDFVGDETPVVGQYYDPVKLINSIR